MAADSIAWAEIDDYCLLHVGTCRFSSLAERLARVIHPSYTPAWLSKSNPALDDDKPIDRIAKGDYRAVARLISGLEDPGTS